LQSKSYDPKRGLPIEDVGAAVVDYPSKTDSAFGDVKTTFPLY